MLMFTDVAVALNGAPCCRRRAVGRPMMCAWGGEKLYGMSVVICSSPPPPATSPSHCSSLRPSAVVFVPEEVTAMSLLELCSWPRKGELM